MGVTGATIAGGPTGGVTTITAALMTAPFLSAMVGSGISIMDAATGHTVNTSITSLSGQTATHGFPYDATMLANGNSVTFSVVHNVYYEPHWYQQHWELRGGTPSTGQIYFSSNQHLAWHDSVSVYATISGTGATPTVSLTELTPEPAGVTVFNTVFNEFLTPVQGNPATTTLPHFMFLSDRLHLGASVCATAVPECSDHFACTASMVGGSPACIMPVPVVMPDLTETSAASTATRGAWSPDGSHFAALLQSSTTPTFYIWNVAFPIVELSSPVKLGGNVKIQ